MYYSYNLLKRDLNFAKCPKNEAFIRMMAKPNKYMITKSVLIIIIRFLYISVIVTQQNMAHHIFIYWDTSRSHDLGLQAFISEFDSRWVSHFSSFVSKLSYA